MSLLLFVTEYGVTVLASTDAPNINHVAHEDAAITHLASMGYIQYHLHRRLHKMVAAYDGQGHTLYHVGRILDSTVDAFLPTLTDAVYVVVLKPVDVRTEQGFLDRKSTRLNSSHRL